mmetsp:Transcript_20572/g.45613  ORF Transcript_20572/g.45613 Transcript_20572/m.45613 type:complete len:1348 (+) Transcript_20572:101-4144(+)
MAMFDDSPTRSSSVPLAGLLASGASGGGSSLSFAEGVELKNMASSFYEQEDSDPAPSFVPEVDEPEDRGKAIRRATNFFLKMLTIQFHLLGDVACVLYLYFDPLPRGDGSWLGFLYQSFARQQYYWHLLVIARLLGTLTMSITVMVEKSPLFCDHRCSLVGAFVGAAHCGPLFVWLDKTLAGCIGKRQAARRARLRDSYRTGLDSLSMSRTFAAEGSEGRNRSEMADADLLGPAPASSRKRSYVVQGVLGLRKLAIANAIPSLMSCWAHFWFLIPSDDSFQELRDHLQILGAAHPAVVDSIPYVLCLVALVVFSIGVADIILYVWVDDHFVKQHKGLVSWVYVVELTVRIPPIIALNIVTVHRQEVWMFFSFVFADMFVMWIIIMTSVSGKKQRGGCSCNRLSHFLGQGSHSAILTLMLFFFNLVYFDPGSAFAALNVLFYVLRYVELAVISFLVYHLNSKTDFRNGAEMALVVACSAITMGANVCFVVPWMRNRYQRRLIEATQKQQGEQAADWVTELAGRSTAGRRPSRTGAPGELPGVGTSMMGMSFVGGSVSIGGSMPAPQAGFAMGAGFLGLEKTQTSAFYGLLDRVGDIFECLLLVSHSESRRNRSRILWDTVVSDLWLAVLAWDGEYEDDQGNLWILEVAKRRVYATSGSLHGDATTEPERVEIPLRGVLVAQHEIQLTMQDGRSRMGLFDGKKIVWENPSGFWSKKTTGRRDKLASTEAISAPERAVAYSSYAETERGGDPLTMRRVLPLAINQLVLGIRWEPQDEIPEKMLSEDREVVVVADSCPLTWFLIKYVFVTKDLSVLSKTYWQLHALAGDAADPKRGNYGRSKLLLLNAVAGNLSFVDTNFRVLHMAEGDDMARFRERARETINAQRSLWHQGDLLHKQISSMKHASVESKTEALQKALGLWDRVHKKLKDQDMSRQTQGLARIVEEKSTMLSVTKRISGHGTGTFSTEADSSSFCDDGTIEECILRDAGTDSIESEVSLVSAKGNRWASLAVEPDKVFLGVDPRKSKVMKSATAPIVLAVKTRPRTADDASMARPVTQRLGGNSAPSSPKPSTIELFMVKFGDDLRQDQLILQLMQLMEHAWEEYLPPEQSRALRLSPYKALAVTPEAGYVKFVPESETLSKALRSSGFNLIKYFEKCKPPEMSMTKVLNNLCGSVAAFTVATYVLGIGDRHLDNLMVRNDGRFFHIDFGFILGDDPKPGAPPVRVPRELIAALEHKENPDAPDRFKQALNLAGDAFVVLKHLAPLWASILKLTAAAGGAGVQKLQQAEDQGRINAGATTRAVVTGLMERLFADHDDAYARHMFLTIVRESSEALYPMLMDKMHQMGLFWH